MVEVEEYVFGYDGVEVDDVESFVFFGREKYVVEFGVVVYVVEWYFRSVEGVGDCCGD